MAADSWLFLGAVVIGWLIGVGVLIGLALLWERYWG